MYDHHSRRDGHVQGAVALREEVVHVGELDAAVGVLRRSPAQLQAAPRTADRAGGLRHGAAPGRDREAVQAGAAGALLGGEGDWDPMNETELAFTPALDTYTGRGDVEMRIQDIDLGEEDKGATTAESRK